MEDDRLYNAEHRGKIGYDNRKQAQIVEKRWRTRRGVPQMDVYPCSFCPFWHIGHRRQKRGTRRRRQQVYP